MEQTLPGLCGGKAGDRPGSHPVDSGCLLRCAGLGYHDLSCGLPAGDAEGYFSVDQFAALRHVGLLPDGPFDLPAGRAGQKGGADHDGYPCVGFP